MLTRMPRNDTDDTWQSKSTRRSAGRNFDFQRVHVSYFYTVALYSTCAACLVFNLYTCKICTRLHSTVHSGHVSFSLPDTCMTWTHGLITVSDAYSTLGVLQTELVVLVADAWHVPQVYSSTIVQYVYRMRI